MLGELGQKDGTSFVAQLIVNRQSKVEIIFFIFLNDLLCIDNGKYND